MGSLCISRIKLVFVGMGALALLIQEEGLSAVRKSQAIKLVGERMKYVSEVCIVTPAHPNFLVNAKYFAPEMERMRDNTPLVFPSSAFTVENLARGTEPYQCTSGEAVDRV
jgi:hypothetical protein